MHEKRGTWEVEGFAMGVLKLAYARKISAVRWRAVVFVSIIISIQVQTSVSECSFWPHLEPEWCPHSASIVL